MSEGGDAGVGAAVTRLNPRHVGEGLAMETVIQLVPGKWVSENLLIGITGMKKQTIKLARSRSWMEGREYKHVSADSEPCDNSMCFYDWRAIEKWIDKLPVATPRRKSA